MKFILAILAAGFIGSKIANFLADQIAAQAAIKLAGL